MFVAPVHHIVLALSKKNSNAIEILTFLHKLADVSGHILFRLYRSEELDD